MSRVLFLSVLLITASEARTQEQEPNDTLVTATLIDPIGSGGVMINIATLGNGDFPNRDVDLFGFRVVDSTMLPMLLTVELASVDDGLDAFLRLLTPKNECPGHSSRSDCVCGRDPSCCSEPWRESCITILEDHCWGCVDRRCCHFDGVELVNNDDAAPDDLDPRFARLVDETGTYFIGVSTASNPHYDEAEAGSGRLGLGGRYALAVVVQSTNIPQDLLDPNDSMDFPVHMGSDSFELPGEFIGDGRHGARDVDIFELELVGAARVDVTASAISGSLLEPFIRVRNCTDPIGQVTLVDPCLMGTSDTHADGSSIVRVSVGALRRRSIFIMISSATNRRYDPTVPGSGERGSMGAYDLSVDVTYVNVVGQNEPDDSIDMATRIGPFVDGRPETVQVEGFIGDGRFAPFQGDRDFYEVAAVEEPRWLSVNVEAETIGSMLDPVLAVFDHDGNPIAYNDNFGAARDAAILVPVPCESIGVSEVRSYVMVSGTKQRPPFDPFLPEFEDAIVKPTSLGDGPGTEGPYRVTFSTSPITTSCINEPDDTIDIATDTGLVDQGTFACKNGFLGDSDCPESLGDQDFWSFRVTKTPVRLEAMAWGCDEPVSPDIRRLVLFDEAGQLMAAQSDWPGPMGLFAVHIQHPGTFYLGVAGQFTSEIDPFTPCTEESQDGEFHLIVRLVPGATRVGKAAVQPTPLDNNLGTTTVFASRLDGTSLIDVIDSTTGEVTSTFAAPEARFGGTEGIAFDGSRLFFMGVGRYPMLYQLDPADGTVLDQFILWMGSGSFSDITILGTNLYVLDLGDRSIQVLDPFDQIFLQTLPVGWLNGIHVGGSLAALAGPGRLYVSDAFSTGLIYELYPQSGVVTNVIDPGETRMTTLGGVGDSLLYGADWRSGHVQVMNRDGSSVTTWTLPAGVGSLAGAAHLPFPSDLDGDDDLDLQDHALFQRCFSGPAGSVISGCEAANVCEDTRIDLCDYAPFSTATTGP